MKTVSIVIPSRNEEKHIEKCLESIVNSTFPKERLTVVVCDGNSKDRTPEIIENYQNRYSYFVYLKNPKQTTPHALNLGIQHTDSDVVIILWAHCYITPDFITNCVQFLDEHPDIGCVGGRIENIYENENSEAIGFATSQSFGVGSSYFRTGQKEGFVDTVAFGAYRREVFEEVGYFDPNLIRNQDDEFNFRVIQKGIKIFLSKNIKSYYVVRSSFKNLYRQYYQYGYWKIYVNKKHKQITSFRQVFPFLFVLFLIGGLVMSVFSIYFLLGYLAILFIYLLTAFFVSFRKKGASLRMRFKIVKCFIILHVAYGSGYANGIGDFIINREEPDRKMGELTR